MNGAFCEERLFANKEEGKEGENEVASWATATVAVFGNLRSFANFKLLLATKTL